jgi:hypothetical protein
VTPDSASSACPWHMLVPSTSVTARDHVGIRADGTTRHGAHHPNGSPGGGDDTPRITPPRHHRRMPWNNHRPRSRRYGAQHQTERAHHMAALRAAGAGLCAERVCVHRTRVITPDDDLHLAHDPTGTVVLGLAHADCNRHEAAVRARAKQGRNSGRTRTTHRQSRLKW